MPDCTVLPGYAHRLGSLDYTLAFHCAPAIAGVKPSNLISLKKPVWMKMRRNLGAMARPLGVRDVFFYRLAECSQRVLLLVYNRKLLTAHLTRPENRVLLESYGYKTEGLTPGLMLARLANRIRENGEYPHEIGVFLGYPAGDVRGFIENGGKDFSLSGYWKVYGDPRRAKEIFSAYDQVRGFFCEQVLGGEKIYTIQYGGTVQ